MILKRKYLDFYLNFDKTHPRERNCMQFYFAKNKAQQYFNDRNLRENMIVIDNLEQVTNQIESERGIRKEYL